MANSFQLKAIISAVDKLSPTLKGIQKNIKITKKSFGDIRAAGGDLLSKLGIGGAALSGGLFGVISKIVSENSKFEKFESILSTIEGSSESAKKSIAWIDKFSNDTPYDLDEVTEAYVQLRAYGIDPTNGSLRSVGDAAAGMGKNIMDVVGALSAAMVGESESLKSFGITAKKAGDTIAYSWSENGKKMVAKANANNRAQIEAVVTGIWNRRYGGAMEKLSSTWEGQLSMLKGYTLNFTRWIGEKGLFDKLKVNLQGVIDKFAAWEKDGTLDRLATEISQNLGEVIDQLGTWLRQVDWSEVWQGLKATVIGVRDFINAVGGLKTILIAIAAIMLAGPVASMIQIVVAGSRVVGVILSIGKAFALLMVANPILLAIVAVIALVAGAAYLIYKNWEPIKEWFSDLWAGIKRGAETLWAYLKEFVSWSPFGLIFKGISKLSELAGGLGGSVVNAVTGPTSDTAGNNTSFKTPSDRSPGARLSAATKTQVAGEMVVKFENAPPGMRTSPGKTDSPFFSLNPDIGYRPFVAL